VRILIAVLLAIVLLLLATWLRDDAVDEAIEDAPSAVREQATPPETAVPAPAPDGGGVNPTIDRIGGVPVSVEATPEQIEEHRRILAAQQGNAQPGSPESSPTGSAPTTLVAPEDSPGASRDPGLPPEAGYTGVPGLPPEAGELDLEFPAPEAGQPIGPGLPPEASDPGTLGPAPEDTDPT
jgi:hypothetical protein